MSISIKNAELVLAIIKSLVTYGVPALFVIADTLKAKDKPTVEDIEGLFITKKPEDYF
jgi:SRSO17 transposase